MWKPTIDPKFLKKVKKGEAPHPTIIKKIAEKIEYKPKQKYYHDYNEVIEYGGSRYFVVYQFHDEQDKVKFIKWVRVVKR